MATKSAPEIVAAVEADLIAFRAKISAGLAADDVKAFSRALGLQDDDLSALAAKLADAAPTAPGTPAQPPQPPPAIPPTTPPPATPGGKRNRKAAPPVLAGAPLDVANVNLDIHGIFDGQGKTYHGIITLWQGARFRNATINGKLQMRGGASVEGQQADIEDVTWAEGSPYGIDGTGYCTGRRLRFSYISDSQGYVMIMGNGRIIFDDVNVEAMAKGRPCGSHKESSIIRYEDVDGQFTRLNIVAPTSGRASVRGGSLPAGMKFVDCQIATPPAGGYGPANRLAENDGGQRMAVKEWRVKDRNGTYQTWFADNQPVCYAEALRYMKAHPNATRTEVSMACLVVARQGKNKCPATPADVAESLRVRDAKITGGGLAFHINTGITGPGIAVESGSVNRFDADSDVNTVSLVSGIKKDYPDPKADGGDARLPGDPHRNWPATLQLVGSKVQTAVGLGLNDADAEQVLRGSTFMHNGTVLKY